MATGIALAYYEKSGSGVTGLTVTTTVYQVALADITSSAIISAQTMTEIGGGLYAYRLPNLDFTTYWYPFTTTTGGDVDTATLSGLVHDFGQLELTAYGASTLTQADIIDDATPFSGADIAAILTDTGTTLPATLATIQAKTDLIGGGSATVVSPVASDGDVTVIRGDNYQAANSRSIDWTETTWTIEATSTIVVIIQDVAAFAGSRTSATAARLQLTSAQSLTLPEGSFDFSLQEITATSERITLLQGTWTTTERPFPIT